MTRANLGVAGVLAGLACSAYACLGGVYGGTHPAGEDCEYGCEMNQEEPSHPWGTPATSTDGGQGGEGGGGAGASGGEGGMGGAAGAESPGGQGGQGGYGGG